MSISVTFIFLFFLLPTFGNQYFYFASTISEPAYKPKKVYFSRSSCPGCSEWPFCLPVSQVMSNH